VSRVTIDFGIDLGTTNSAAAVLDGTEPTVIRNVQMSDYTPSAVWLGPNGELVVGSGAKAKVGRDPQNAFTSFKRSMGTADEFSFARNGLVMRAEDLSAEVLKSIKADIACATGESPTAAVVTVPAAFDQPQCAATKLAAQKAGWAQSPLLQEPVAAALKYGFQHATEKAFWLVYDLGGGTFDAAVVTNSDGVFQVVNHLGDNHLGGADVDRAIVDELLLPELSSRYGAEICRGEPKWAGALAALEAAAEEAKIAVSRRDVSTIQIVELKDAERNVVVEDFVFDLRRRDVDRLMEPWLQRTLELCRRVLAEKRLDADNLEKVILVGGPTLAPITRLRLADLGSGVADRLEYRYNALTVVAEGAAVFAGTQRLETQSRPSEAGAFEVHLDYKPIGADTEPFVGGVVQAPHCPDMTGFTLEFVNRDARPEWRSGRLSLAGNGAFVATLWAEKGRANTFWIELADSTGTPQRIQPDRFTYTVGNVFSDVPLPHTVGVALADNMTEDFFRKGEALPSRDVRVLHTAFDARAGGSSTMRIPFIEGQSARADRNTEFGVIVIPESALARTVPAGSEVEVTIWIDASRDVRAEVYIPLLDDAFEASWSYDNYREKARDPAGLSAQISAEKERLAELREKANVTDDENARAAIRRVDDQQLVKEVDGAAVAMSADTKAAGRCEQQLRDLQKALDAAEEALRWPALVADAQTAIDVGQGLVDESGDDDDRRRFPLLRKQVQEAIRTADVALLTQRLQELYGLVIPLFKQSPTFHYSSLQRLRERVPEMTDQGRAQELLALADRAVLDGDMDGLQAANEQLEQLLPGPPPRPDGSWLTR
jgi:molecular chaperone DnaK